MKQANISAISAQSACASTTNSSPPTRAITSVFLNKSRSVALNSCKARSAAAALSALCYRTLLNDGRAAVAAAHAGAITPAFERIVEANTLLSGLGFESGGLAVAHSVHNGLTAAPETHAYLHGEKVAFGTLVQLVLEGRDSAQVEEVMQFCHAVGLPITLQALGIAALTRDTARAIATRATAIGETAHNEPFVVTVDAVMDALYAADAWGQAFQSAQ